MSQKPLWRLSVHTTPEAEEAVAELLTRVVNSSPVSWNNLETGSSVVSVYLQRKPSGAPALKAKLSAGLKAIRAAGLSPGQPRILLQRMRSEDWAESWKRHFKPMSIGSRLLLQASWHKRRPRPGQKLVVLDPGLSFGTGHHPTTAYCLRQLVRCRLDGTSQSLLDIGTGSGILAIAAAMLGYDPVEGFDFDPESVRAARANAQANGLLRKIRITRQDLARLPVAASKTNSLVCANLTADLLVAQRGRILSRLDRRGTLVIAGVLAKEFPLVETTYEAEGLRLVSARSQKGWRSGVFMWR